MAPIDVPVTTAAIGQNENPKPLEKIEVIDPLDIGHIVEVIATPEEEALVLRKTDLYILPLMLFAYMLQFIDKSTISSASVLGVIKDTNLVGTQFSWISSMFYFGYLASSWPTSYLMVRFPIGKFLACSVAIWGCILMCHGACNSFSSLMAVRFLLGCAEAGVTPGFGLIVGMFYTKEEQTARQMAWSFGFCFGNIISGVCAYGVGMISGSPLAHWRLLFLIFGGVTTAYSIPLIFLLPDSPAKAPFLTPRQREVAVHRTISNKTGILDEGTYKLYQMLEALRDPQAWLLSCSMLCICITNGALNSFYSLIISGFGFSYLQTLLLGMPMGALQIILFIYTIVLSFFYRNCRLIIMIQMCLVALVGVTLIWALDSSQRVGKLVGVYMGAQMAVTFPLSVSVVSSNVAGFTKKATVSAMLFIAYSVGNIIGPQLFLSKEAPKYETGLRALVIGLALASTFLIVLFIYYVFENRRRERISPLVNNADSGPQMDEISNATDMENLQFRYLL